MATNKSPVFPMPEPHHFSDYGFDPQIDYFQQVLEEAKRFKHKESLSSSRSIDGLHFKLQKPITKDDPRKKRRSSVAAAKNHHRRWWKAALFFFKSRWAHPSKPVNSSPKPGRPAASLSGPIYCTESLSGPSTPSRSRAYSGPLSSSRNGAGGLDFAYLNLRELNMDPPHRISSPSPLPIYLVT